MNDDEPDLFTKIIFSKEVELYGPPFVAFFLTAAVVLFLIYISEGTGH